jgi:hypothetical protein
MDSRLSEALDILGVAAIDEVTAVYVNDLVASKPSQEAWIKYAFHYVKMIAGESLPKDEEVFRDRESDEFQFEEEIEIDELSDAEDENLSSYETPGLSPEESYLFEFESYLPDPYSMWKIRRRNLENLLNYLPNDAEISDDFEMLSKYYALEIYRKSLLAFESHEFTYDFFEESVLEMSNFEKLEVKILQELSYIGIDYDEGGFGVRFNKFIRDFIREMNEIKE